MNGRSSFWYQTGFHPSFLIKKLLTLHEMHLTPNLRQIVYYPSPKTSAAVFESLYRLVRHEGVAALIATHNLELARHMDRVFALKDGRLEEQARG